MYKGRYERAVDRKIKDQQPVIEINWINISVNEACSGGADRITRKLIEAGYHPDGSGVAEQYRENYEAGRIVDGRYLRLPMETWMRGGEAR